MNDAGSAATDDVDELLAAASLSDRLALLTSAGAVDGHRLNDLLDQAEDRVHSNPAAAEALAVLVDTAAAAALEVQTPPATWTAAQARARYQRARILADRGELDAALALIEQARSLWEAAGEPLAALRTNLGLMQVLQDLGRHQAAIAVAQDLIAEVDRRPDAEDALTRRIRAHAMDNLGAAFGYTGEHDRALAAYAEARAAYLELGLDEEAARPLANRGVELLALGRPREAMADLRAASQVFIAAGDLLFAAQCQGDLASAHRQLGQFSEALVVLERARGSLDELGAHAEADRLRLALAETYLALSLYPEARAAAAETAERTARAGMRNDHGHAQLLLGLSHLATGDAAEADAQLASAETAFDDASDRQYLARTRLARAEAAALAGDVAAALAAAEQASIALEAGGWLPTLTLSYLRRLDWTDDPQLVATLLADAGALVEQLRLPTLTFAYALRRARWLRQCGESARAETALRYAVSEVDRASAALTDYVIRSAFRADRAAVYDELVELLLDRGDVEQASRVSDEAKARTLLELREQAVGSGPRLAGGRPDLAAAYADLTATYTALHEAPDAATRQLLRERADQLEREVSSLRLRHVALDGSRPGPLDGPLPAPLEGSTPDPLDKSTPDPLDGSTPGTPDGSTPGPLDGSLPGTLDGSRPRNAAPGCAATLAFHVLGPDIVAFTGDPGAVRAHRLPGAADRLRELLDALAVQWLRRSRPSRGPHQEELLLAATRATLGDTYDLLLRPLRPDLDALAAGSGAAADAEGHGEAELRVVPHGLVGSVPFCALFDGERYVGERWAVTVTPTLGPARPDPTPQRLAVVVSVADDAIPAADDEAKLVAAVLDDGGHRVNLLASGAATTAGVIGALAGAAIVHLACHATFRPENPLFSRLRLADRWLTTSEIVHLDLSAALVTLSACDSGRTTDSAEPIGLGWAFLAAGAAGVVVSQWTVDDESARELMVRFYAELVAGAAPPIALRRAQRRLAVDRPHPYFWAPFTYLGSSGARTEPPVQPPLSGGT